jgi:multiple sugar transport system permease protein
MGMKHYRARRRISSILKWSVAIVALVIALFPIWWMFNIAFSDPGVPVSTNPRLYPSSLPPASRISRSP